MEIILVTSTFPQLSETFIVRKAIGLAQRGHQVRVVATNRGNWDVFKEYFPLPPTLTVTYLKLPSKAELGLIFQTIGISLGHIRSAFYLWQLCCEHTNQLSQRLKQYFIHLPFIGLHADILNFEFLGLAAAYPLLDQWLGIATILSCRGTDLHLTDQQPFLKRAAYIARLVNVLAVHCVTNELSNEALRLSNRANGIWINRPAIEVAHIPIKKTYAITTAPLIVSVGRLVWIKGYDYLLASLAIIKAKGIAFRAEIIGGGPLKSHMEATIHALNLQDCVQFQGANLPNEVLLHLSTADIFALSSHAEGISNAVLEAMAAGLPIITTDAGGMKEAITDGVEGFVTPPRQVTQFAEKLAILLTDTALRMQMGQAARQRVVKEFTIQRQIDVFEIMYQAVSAGNVNPPPEFAPQPFIPTVSAVALTEFPLKIIHVCTIAPLVWESALEFAVDAVGMLNTSGHTVTFTIVGAGDYRDAIVYAARQWKIWDNQCVALHEQTPTTLEDIQAVLHGNDIFLMPPQGVQRALIQTVLNTNTCLTVPIQRHFAEAIASDILQSARVVAS